MDTLTQFDRALQHIEQHLAGDVDYGRVAQIVGCSEYHFRRTFAFLAGMSLSEYVRLRRMSEAGRELLHSDQRIIDLAVRYGYTSADAFSRSFKAVHGVLPSEARLQPAALRVIFPLTFRLIVEGGTTMQYRLETRPRFNLVGTRHGASARPACPPTCTPP